MGQNSGDIQCVCGSPLSVEFGLKKLLYNYNQGVSRTKLPKPVFRDSPDLSLIFEILAGVSSSHSFFPSISITNRLCF